MVLLMIISIFQICFLPGFILYKLFFKSLHLNSLFLFIIYFALSLLVNYSLVGILLILGLYGFYSLMFVFCIEVMIVLYFIYRKRDVLIETVANIHKKLNALFLEFFKFEFNINYFLRLFFLFWSVYILYSMTNLAIDSLGGIFNAWDSVVSWNRWAGELYSGQFPSLTYGYPMLMPANWSLSYVIQKYPLQFIAKGIMSLFFLSIILGSTILGLVKKNLAYLTIPPIMTLISNSYWNDGMIDIPVTFFVFLLIIIIFEASSEKLDKNRQLYFLLGSLVVITSALTKQAGLFFIILYPLLFITISENKYTLSNIYIYLKQYLLLILVFIVPWYLYIQYKISIGQDSSAVEWITNGIYHGMSLFERFNVASDMFISAFKENFVSFTVAFFFIVSMKNKKVRALNLIATIPYYILWAFFFSYDLRNVYLLFPLIGLSVGTGIIETINIVKFLYFNQDDDSSSYIYRVVLHLFFIILFLATIGISFFKLEKKISLDGLGTKHTELEKSIGDPFINSAIYEYIGDQTITKNILSNYQYLKYLPILKDHYTQQLFEKRASSDFDEFQSNLKIKNIGYILYPIYTDEKIQDYIKERIRNKSAQLIFDIHDFKFVVLK